VPGIARYLVEGRSRIVIDPHPGTAPERILTFLRGIPLAFACHLWNLLPLNTACTALDGGAALVSSGPALGKSTMALALAQRGSALMGDAMCTLDTTDSSAPVIWPSFPDVALWPDSIDALGISLPPDAVPGPGGRFRINATPWFDPTPRPPFRLMLIKKTTGTTPSQEPIALGPLLRFQAVANLVCAIDIARILPGHAARLEAIGLLSSRLAMAEFHFPPNLDHISRQAEMLAAPAGPGAEQAPAPNAA
jgi:hypothetical protein